MCISLGVRSNLDIAMSEMARKYPQVLEQTVQVLMFKSGRELQASWPNGWPSKAHTSTQDSKAKGRRVRHPLCSVTCQLCGVKILGWGAVDAVPKLCPNLCTKVVCK